MNEKQKAKEQAKKDRVKEAIRMTREEGKEINFYAGKALIKNHQVLTGREGGRKSKRHLSTKESLGMIATRDEPECQHSPARR